MNRWSADSADTIPGSGARHGKFPHSRKASVPGFLAVVLSLVALQTAVSQGQELAAKNEAGRDSRWAILVTGASGEPDLKERYLQEMQALQAELRGPLGFPADRVFVLFEDPSLDPEHIQYKSTAENLAAVLREIAGRATREDLVFVYFAGHGSADGDEYKLNLVGPDPTAGEISVMLKAIPAARFVIVNTTSCSGASLKALAGPNRIVVTATRSGTEKNLTHFSEYFVDAFLENKADVDKNGRVSIYEAFSYAAQKVGEYYTKEGSLASEHPGLSEDGNPEPLTLTELIGRSSLQARTAYLDLGSPLLGQGDGSPEAQAMAREAQDLEKQIELLKSARDEYTQEEYDKRLEALLLKLAEIQLKLRKKQL